MGQEDQWVFLVSDTYGAEDGRTVCLMITRALPSCKEDVIADGNSLIPTNSQNHRAKHQFCKEFGPWYSLSAEIISRGDFFNRYEEYLPEKLKELSGKCCDLEYSSKFHFNPA
jgi:hypothetical protein